MRTARSALKKGSNNRGGKYIFSKGRFLSLERGIGLRRGNKDVLRRASCQLQITETGRVLERTPQESRRENTQAGDPGKVPEGDLQSHLINAGRTAR